MKNDEILHLLSELKQCETELQRKYATVSMLTGLTKSELDELGGF